MQLLYLFCRIQARLGKTHFALIYIKLILLLMKTLRYDQFSFHFVNIFILYYNSEKLLKMCLILFLSEILNRIYTCRGAFSKIVFSNRKLGEKIKQVFYRQYLHSWILVEGCIFILKKYLKTSRKIKVVYSFFSDWW